MPVKTLLEQELHESSPYVRWFYVVVTFPAADTDLDIPHTLLPLDPDAIEQEVVKKDRACDVQNDQSGTRRAWTINTVTLRCTVASAVVTIRLAIRRT